MLPRRLDNLFRRNVLHLPLHQFQFNLMRYSFMLLTALFAFSAQGQTTFNVDMTCAPEGFTDVFVTGPWCGWCANDVYNTMTDDDGDGIYTVTLDSTVTGLIEYKYAINGFADQENLINDMVNGASCAPVTDFAGYANRQIEEGSVANDSYGTCDGSCNDSNSNITYDVTFRLDVGAYPGTVSSASMFGTFSGWDANGNPMSDADGDGVYELTLSLEPGLQEYKYRINFSADENFDGSEACTTPPAEFVNRVVDVVDNATLEVVCWNSCDACGDSNGGGGNPNLPTYDLTINLNMANEVVSAEGVFLTGGAAFGVPGDNPMSDEDGDGIYSLTLQVDSGFASDYTFTNGACLDYSCKENIAGQPCAVPPFNDRRLDPMSGPVTINTCFSQCTDDGSCSTPAADVDVTFNVDVSQQTLATVYVFGSFNGWNDSEIEMQDVDGDGTYSATVSLAPGNYEFKYLGRDADNNVVNETLTEGDACTVNGSPFVNRALEVIQGDAVSLDAVCFGSCSTCAVEPSVLVATVDLCGADADTVRLTGPFWGWDPIGGPIATDNGDGTWSVTFDPAPEANMEYLWIVDGTQENLIQAMADGGSCAPVTDFANYANRLWELGAPDPQDVYNSCSACEIEVSGCTDPTFLEFNPYAASDDGSCTTAIVYGCIYQAASNYNALANVDDNSCEFDNTSDCQADLDGDGAITTGDLLAFLASFGQTCL